MGFVIFLFSIAAGLMLLMGIVELSDRKDSRETKKRIEAMLPTLKNSIKRNYGIDCSDCNAEFECVNRFNEISKQNIKNAYYKLQQKYGFSEVNDDGIAITNIHIILNAKFPSGRWNFSSEDVSKNIAEMDKIVKLWDDKYIEKQFKVIAYENVEYFTVKGDVHYETNVSGGGANIQGAAKGAFLFGDAGAIVGSRVGTEISSSTRSVDNRRLMVRLKSTGEEICIATQYKIEELLFVLRKMIPEKEYSAEGGFVKKEETVTKKGYNEELIELKALLDSGVITQEEFDAKKKQLLGL